MTSWYARGPLATSCWKTSPTGWAQSRRGGQRYGGATRWISSEVRCCPEGTEEALSCGRGLWRRPSWARRDLLMRRRGLCGELSCWDQPGEHLAFHLHTWRFHQRGFQRGSCWLFASLSLLDVLGVQLLQVIGGSRCPSLGLRCLRLRRRDHPFPLQHRFGASDDGQRAADKHH